MNAERPEESVDEAPENLHQDLPPSEEPQADESQDAIEPADALGAILSR